MTSKYRRLSSWGTALIPGTLYTEIKQGCTTWGSEITYGSAISRSVSLTMRFGRAAMVITKRNFYDLQVMYVSKQSLGVSFHVGSMYIQEIMEVSENDEERDFDYLMV